MLYLSGTYSVVPEMYRHRMGYMLNVMRAIGGEAGVLANHTWMLDNGAFSERWDESIWRTRLEQLAPHNSSCIAAVVPDVILDARATLERWPQYAPFVQALGYKAAYATQNGCTPDLVPWDELNVLFIGGNDEHRHREIWPLIREAKRRGVWVHVGRVNSPRAMWRYQAADSVDGTNFRFQTQRGRIQTYINAAERITNLKCQPKLLSMPL